MRILAGTYRGRQIKGPPRGTHTRPILARIKKSLFDIMSARLHGCRFLDLYAGTGSVGIEALSRGASWVTFVENDRRCLDTIRQSCALLGIRNNTETIKADILYDFKNKGSTYDTVFMGPPYKDAAKKMIALTGPTLEMLLKERLCTDNALIIAQHHVKEPVPDIRGLIRVRQEKYGDSYISFYRKQEVRPPENSPGSVTE